MVYTGSSHDSSEELQDEVSRLEEGSGDLIDRLLEIKKNTEEAKESIEDDDLIGL